jgi:hypothetical protein
LAPTDPVTSVASSAMVDASDAPKFTGDDLKTIGEPVDFVGINVYRPSYYVVASD